MPAATPSGWLIVALIGGGLIVDQHVAVWGQFVVNVATSAVLLYWMTQSSPDTPLNLGVCVAYATLGEIFLSLGWGL